MPFGREFGLYEHPLVLPQLTHLKQLPLGTMSIPQVAHDGASPAAEVGLPACVGTPLAPATPDASVVCVNPSSSFKTVLGLRYSGERNLPPTQRAI